MTTLAARLTTGQPGAVDDLNTWIDTASPDQMRTALHRIAALASASSHYPPPDGSLVIVGTSGGHQDQPYQERVYIREDDTDLPQEEREASYIRRDGDWYEFDVDHDRRHRQSWGELNWLDDPECDRGVVDIDGHWLHNSTLIDAMTGDTP